MSISRNALLLALFAFVAGCGPSGPTFAIVKGKVELDGKPLASGKVAFTQQGIPQDLLDVNDGVFEGKAKVGKAKVEILSFRPGKIPDMYKDAKDKEKYQFLENIIPAAYNSESKITADITASGPNEFQFSAKTK